MANRRQIPFLYWRKRADGSEYGQWKPSPRLRKLGWANLTFEDRVDAESEARIISAALARNRELAEWEAKGAAGAAAPLPEVKVWLITDLIAAFKTSTDWQELKASTQREYGVRFKFIEAWAREPSGRSMAVTAITDEMVRDLKTAMLENGGSRFRCAGTLRVLRLLFNRPEALKLTRGVNPTKGVKIPGTDSRQQKFALAQAEDVADRAAEAGHHVAALAVRIGFWSMQREGDLLALNRLAWRQLENLDARDRPALVNDKGEVWGFRLRQIKTNAWIDAPIPAALHGAIEAAFQQSQWLLHDPFDAASPMPAWRLQRQLRPIFNAAGFADKQFRDLRRSGMSFFKDHGALQSNIFAISGHAVLGKKTIVDTYMPPDTAAACAAVAAVLRTLERIKEREKADVE